MWSTSVHVCRVGSFRSRLTVRKKTVGGWGRWEGGTQGQRGRKGRGREGQGRHGVRGPAEAKPTSSPSSSSLSVLTYPRAMTPSEKTPCKHARHGTARHSTARSSAAQRNATRLGSRPPAAAAPPIDPASQPAKPHWSGRDRTKTAQPQRATHSSKVPGTRRCLLDGACREISGPRPAQAQST